MWFWHDFKDLSFGKIDNLNSIAILHDFDVIQCNSNDLCSGMILRDSSDLNYDIIQALSIFLIPAPTNWDLEIKEGKLR